jgi:hypothetical protein
MRLEPLGRDAGVRVGPDARLHGHDLGIDDCSRAHLPQPHPDEVEEADMRIRRVSPNPQPAEAHHHGQHHQREDDDQDANDRHPNVFEFNGQYREIGKHGGSPA